jgi:gliding motility-associated-like protein
MKPLITKFVCALFMNLASFTILSAQSALPEPWVTNGAVRHIARGDGKVFLSGGFDWVGPSYGSGAAIFNTTLTHDNSYPRIDKDLRTAVADDAGGWYIAGDRNIKHLKADKTIDEFAINVEGYIYTLAKAGNILYIGGSFSSVNNVARANLAAIDLTTGNLTNWNPNANSYVHAIKVSGSIVYAGGYFLTIGGQARSKIAALDASTGLATTWNANVSSSNGTVHAIIVDANTVYFSGSFSNVGGGSPSRTNFAAVDATTAALVAFNPRPNGITYKLLLDGNTLYMAGSFTQVAATAKPDFAALNVTTGALTACDVTVDNNVLGLAIDGQKLFIGGDFTTVNNEGRPRLAAVNKITGILEPMDDEKISDGISVLVASGGNILALSGDYFQGVAGETRKNGCAALEESTGLLTDWIPEMPSPTNDGSITEVFLHYKDNRVYYLQKIYHYMDGYYETALGAVNSTNGTAIGTWSVAADDEIEAWTFSEDALYLAGQFTEINGEPRAGFAAVDLETGDVLPWVISFVPTGGEINSMAIRNNVLYVGGNFFLTDNGKERNNLAAWDATTGDLTDWAPEYFSDFGEPKIGAVTDTHVYVIGNGIYSVDATSGESDPGWLALFNEGQVNAMAIHGSALYVGGYFSSQQAAGLARIDITTGEITGAQPELEDHYASEGSAVNVIAVSGTKLFVGGDFSLDVGGIQRANFIVYEIADDSEMPTAVIDEDLVTICSDINASLTVEAVGTDLTYQWQTLNENTDEFEDITDPDQYEGTTTSTLTIIIAEDFEGGEYRCLVSSEEGEQFSNVATVTVTAPCNQPPVIVSQVLETQVGGVVNLDLIPLITTESDNLDPNSITISELPSSGATATVVDGVLIIDYAGISFSGTEQITIRACNIHGNCTEQLFTIEVVGDIFVYNGVSPNGANPALIIRYIELLPETKNNQVTIYDRWQNEVWRGKNYDNSTVAFEGTSAKGSDLPTGTYFYKIEFNGGRKTQTGFISLKR